MTDTTAALKENRVWWFVLLVLAIVTALLVLPGSYIDKNVWQTTVLTLAGMWILGIAINVGAQGVNALLTAKGEAAKATAEAAKTSAQAQQAIADAQRANSR